MKYRLKTIAGMLALAAALPANAAEAAAPLGRNNADFAVDLYHQLRKKEGNLFVSPHSISNSFAMAYAGAGGNTAKEIATALHFKVPVTQLGDQFGALNKSVMATANSKGDIFGVANALCATGSMPVQAYLDKLMAYDAEVFGGDLDAINSWVKEKTKGKIDTILEELSPNSLCVLLNAVYFKGTWASQFDSSLTSEQPFHLTGGKKAAMMRQTSDFRYVKSKGFGMLEMPYASGMTMVVFLPEQIDGLATFEETLSAEKLADWLQILDAARVSKVEVSFPKFKIGSDLSLIDVSNSLGIKDAFDGNAADFVTMYGKRGVFISQIRHKAVIELDETGSEAAAATAIEARFFSLSENLSFVADHPFFFLIRDKATQSILFMGRVADPSAE